LSSRTSLRIRAFDPVRPVTDVAWKLSASNRSSASALWSFTASCHLLSSERRCAFVIQSLLPDKSKVGRRFDVRSRSGSGEVLLACGLCGSTARTGFSFKILREDFSVETDGRGVAEGCGAGEKAGVGCSLGVGEGVGGGFGVGLGFGVGVGLGVGIGVGLGVGEGFGFGVGVDGVGEGGKRKVGAGASCAEIIPPNAQSNVQIRRNFAPFFISGAKNSRARGIVVRALRRSTRFHTENTPHANALDEFRGPH
jgi:hypothetical protein